jgi:hypothetical protein
MGELVDLREYRAFKAKEKADKELADMDQTINELDMLKRVLEGIVKDLPDVSTSIMYVPIEPKLDAFMSKPEDLDGYLDYYGLKLPPTEDDDEGED